MEPPFVPDKLWWKVALCWFASQKWAEWYFLGHLSRQVLSILGLYMPESCPRAV